MTWKPKPVIFFDKERQEIIILMHSNYLRII